MSTGLTAKGCQAFTGSIWHRESCLYRYIEQEETLPSPHCRRPLRRSLTGVLDGWLKDEDGVVGEVVGDDEPPLAVDRLRSVELGEESQHVAVESSPVLLHELYEVLLRRRRHEALRGAERVLLAAEAVVGRNLLRRPHHLRQPLRHDRREVGWQQEHNRGACY